MARRRLMFLLMLAARAAPAQAPTTQSPSSLRAAFEVGLRHTGQLDQTLSPLRYGGGGTAARLSLDALRGLLQFAADADFSLATLSANVGSGDSPSMRAIASAAHFGIVRQLRQRPGGLSLSPGIRLAGRVAAREHRFTRSQTYGRYDGSIADSYDAMIALQPQLRAMRPLGAGVLSLAAAASAFGISAHPYYPQSLGPRTTWSGSGPSAALLADGSIEFARASSRRTGLGARYSVQLLRLRGASPVTEVSHQLGAVFAWHRSAR